MNYLILVYLIYFEYPITLFHGQPHLVQYPPSGQGLLLILGMPTFFTGGAEDEWSTQAKHEFIAASEGEDRMIQPSGGTIEFDQAVHTEARFFIFTRVSYVNE